MPTEMARLEYASTFLPLFASKELEQVPEDAKMETDPVTLFERILVEPLRDVQHDGDTLVVLDALDECARQEQASLLNIVSNKWHDLPEWLRLFVSTRPEHPIAPRLERFQPEVLLLGDANHVADVRECIVQHLKPLMPPHLLQAATEELLQRSEGLFLYLHFVFQGLRGKHTLSIADIQKFPAGLSGAFEENFGRLNDLMEAERPGVDLFRRLLAPIVTARKPLPPYVLGSLLKLDERQLMSLLGKARLFLMQDGEGKVQLVHKKMYDWLTGDAVAITAHGVGRDDLALTLEAGHQQLADFCIELPDTEFALENGVHHLCEVINKTTSTFKRQ